MAKSNAEFQREYRERKKAEGTERKPRINTYIDLEAKAALERLASLYGLSQREIMERALIHAEQVTVSEYLTPNELEPYYQETLKKSVISHEVLDLDGSVSA
ncbi:hypothetical protein [Escherichia coli]|uniref:hypothetical protein n=1 Tax=Escherichia coli TaxID=562 RepID=UPI001D0C7A31|nr:hypothetical protein [Escherichia coli]